MTRYWQILKIKSLGFWGKKKWLGHPIRVEAKINNNYLLSLASLKWSTLIVILVEPYTDPEIMVPEKRVCALSRLRLFAEHYIFGTNRAGWDHFFLYAPSETDRPSLEYLKSISGKLTRKEERGGVKCETSHSHIAAMTQLSIFVTNGQLK